MFAGKKKPSFCLFAGGRFLSSFFVWQRITEICGECFLWYFSRVSSLPWKIAVLDRASRISRVDGLHSDVKNSSHRVDLFIYVP